MPLICSVGLRSFGTSAQQAHIKLMSIIHTHAKFKVFREAKPTPSLSPLTLIHPYQTESDWPPHHRRHHRSNRICGTCNRSYPNRTSSITPALPPFEKRYPNESIIVSRDTANRKTAAYRTTLSLPEKPNNPRL